MRDVVPVKTRRGAPFATIRRMPARCPRRRRAAFVALAAVAALAAPVAAQQSFDVLLRGGEVCDGTGAPARRADVGIRQDRVVAIDDLADATATTVLDCAGLVVAPGFLDVHTHVDSDLARLPGCDNFARMGVTTIITGNCGGSVKDLAAHFERVRKGGVGVNYGSLVGAGTVRQQVLGTANRAPTEDELARMGELVATAMRDGAFGVSTGLIYVPGTYARTDEITALARVAGRFGGLYASHIRNENNDILDAVAEALRIGHEAKVTVEISHVKNTGKPNWGRSSEVLALLTKARAAGQRVHADQYAYDASSTGLDVLFPSDALAIGRKQFGEQLAADPAFRAQMRAALRQTMVKVGFGDFRYARIAHAPGNADLDGSTIAEAALRRRGSDDPDAQAELAMDLYAKAGEQRVSMIYHTIGEADVVAYLQQDWIAIASDAGVRPLDGDGKPHPRGAGNTVRVLGRYVREQKVLSLPTAIRKLTSVPAAAFGIRDRGVLQPGAFADVVAFDPQTVGDRATFAEPLLPPVGMRWVLVNGTVVVDGERVTGARPGRVLLGPGATPTAPAEK